VDGFLSNNNLTSIVHKITFVITFEVLLMILIVVVTQFIWLRIGASGKLL